jgi:hypothetical protein
MARVQLVPVESKVILFVSWTCKCLMLSTIDTDRVLHVLLKYHITKSGLGSQSGSLSQIISDLDHCEVESLTSCNINVYL